MKFLKNYSVSKFSSASQGRRRLSCGVMRTVASSGHGLLVIVWWLHGPLSWSPSAPLLQTVVLWDFLSGADRQSFFKLSLLLLLLLLPLQVRGIVGRCSSLTGNTIFFFYFLQLYTFMKKSNFVLEKNIFVALKYREGMLPNNNVRLFRTSRTYRYSSAEWNEHHEQKAHCPFYNACKFQALA